MKTSHAMTLHGKYDTYCQPYVPVRQYSELLPSEDNFVTK